MLAEDHGIDGRGCGKFNLPSEPPPASAVEKYAAII